MKGTWGVFKHYWKRAWVYTVEVDGRIVSTHTTYQSARAAIARADKMTTGFE